MIYGVAIMGFLLGFFVGQVLLSFLLRDYSKQEILDMMKDKGARLRYGLLNWVCAGAGLILFVQIYKNLS